MFSSSYEPPAHEKNRGRRRQKQKQNWSPGSWKDRVALQLPQYDDEEALESSLRRLRRCSPLVFAGEVRSLHKSLAKACDGDAFLFMGGDCAETFEDFTSTKFETRSASSSSAA